MSVLLVFFNLIYCVHNRVPKSYWLSFYITYVFFYQCL